MKSLLSLKTEFQKALRVGWFLAFRQIRRSGRGTTALIIFIMVLTFLNLVVVSGLLVGLMSGAFKQFQESYSGEVIVTTATGHNYIENSSNLINFLRAHPEVKSFSTRHTIGATVLGTLTDLPQKNQRANQMSTQLVGIDPVAEQPVTGFSRFVSSGAPLGPNDWGKILIGRNLIKKYSSFADANIPGLDFLEKVDIGSRVRVSFSTTDGNLVAKEFIIQGIVKSKVDQISARVFILDKELEQMLPVNKEQYQEIAIRTNPNYAPTLVKEIKNFLGTGYEARAQTASEAIPSFLRDVETTMGVLGNALSSIALVVAAITIFIVIFINAVTKRKFIGIMKGIGISPLSIKLSYVIQALFYGVVGSAVGLLLTFGLLQPYFNAYPIDFPFSDGILVATASGASIRVAILLVVTLLAGYIPAMLIVRKNTLDSILGRN
jgi:ABC-type lipoprotein release transport system permease subunit